MPLLARLIGQVGGWAGKDKNKIKQNKENVMACLSLQGKSYRQAGIKLIASPSKQAWSGRQMGRNNRKIKGPILCASPCADRCLGGRSLMSVHLSF